MREKSNIASMHKSTSPNNHNKIKLNYISKLKQASIIISSLFQLVMPSSLLELSHTVSTARYTYSATSIGETVIHSFRNNLFSSNVFNAPYTETSIQLPSSFLYSVHLDTIKPYIICADILGTVYILDPTDELNILKTININAAGRARFFRSHVYGFDHTNYFFLINRNLEGTGSFFHDWSLLDNEVKQLTMDSEIIRLGSFERVSMILSVEEDEGKKIMKTDPTASVDIIESFTHTEEINGMLFLNEAAGLSVSKHIAATSTPTTAKLAIYDSTSDAFTNEKEDPLFEVTIDILVIGETNYVGVCVLDPVRFIMVKVPTMEISVLDYGGDDPDLENVKFIRQFAYIEDSEFIWLGIDNQFDMYKVLPPVCHASCDTCIKGVLVNGCDTCPADHNKRGGVCIPDSNDCITLLNPFYFPETDTCGEVCENGFFAQSTDICRSCVPNCQVCGDKLTCDTCAAGFEKDSNQLCKRKCDLDEYFEGGTCKSCHDSCKSCDGPDETDCTLCFELVDVEDDGTCANPCPFGQYFNNNLKVCQSCSYPCQGCEVNNGMKCLSCRSNLYKTEIEGQSPYVSCQTFCEEGYYQDTSEATGELICSKCPEGCSSCESSRNLDGDSVIECSTCKPEFFYYKSECLSECPLKTFHNMGFSYPLCSNCFEDCMICNSVNFCEECDEGFSLDSDSTFCRSGIQGQPDNGNRGNNGGGGGTEDEGSDSSFIISFFIVLIISIVFMILISKRKAVQDRRERERRRLMRNTPLAEAFHPIIPSGERNPLEPINIDEQAIDPSNVHTSIPVTNQNCVFGRQDTFLEIDVMKDSARSAKPVRGGNIDLRNLDRKPNLTPFTFAPLRNGGVGKIVPVGNIDYPQAPNNDVFNFKEEFISNKPMAPKPYMPPNLGFGLPAANGPQPNRNDRRRMSKISMRNKRMFVNRRGQGGNPSRRNID